MDKLYMNGQMDRQVDEWMDGSITQWMNCRMEGLMDGYQWMNSMNRQRDGWMDENGWVSG